MHKEFKFFIEEDHPKVVAWAREREQADAIAVGNDDQLLEYLKKHTEPNDDLSCRISGAWLDSCVKWSVRTLLIPHNLSEKLPQRSVSNVTVDLAKCMAFDELHREMSIEDRRILLKTALWHAGDDPRLTILPRGGV